MICCRCGVNTTYGYSADGKDFCHNCACISLAELTSEGFFEFKNEFPYMPQSDLIEEKIPVDITNADVTD